MSCTTNSNRGKLAALKCGLAAAASTAAYLSGIAAGATLGGAGGALCGATIGGPVGTVTGAAVGAWAGGQAMITTRAVKTRLAAAVEKRRTAAKEEQRWRASDEGRQAVFDRDRQLKTSKVRYDAFVDQLEMQRKNAKADFESARTAGAALVDDQAVVNRQLAKSAGNILGQAALAARWGTTGQGLVGVAGRGLLREVAGLEQQLEKGKSEAWLKTDAGQEARAAYRAKVSTLALKRKKMELEYRLRKEAIAGHYQQARSAFFSTKPAGEC